MISKLIQPMYLPFAPPVSQRTWNCCMTQAETGINGAYADMPGCSLVLTSAVLTRRATSGATIWSSLMMFSDEQKFSRAPSAQKNIRSRH